MAIGLEEKKSAVQPGLIILFVATIVGASIYFAFQAGLFKKTAGGADVKISAAGETANQNINIDFNFLKDVVGIKGEDNRLEAFPDFPKMEQLSSGSAAAVQPGRENPFKPVEKSAAAAVKNTAAATTTDQEAAPAEQ